VSKHYRILYIEGTGNLAGGGQISLLELLKKLNREKFEPVVICPFKGNLTSRLESMGIETVIVPMNSPKKNLFTFIVSVKKLKDLFLKLKVNLVHANTSRCALYGGLAAKSLGIPVIWHIRVIESEGLYDRFLVSLCTQLITVSVAVQKRFRWLLRKHPEKIAVIHNGVDLREFNPEINGNDVRKEFDIPLDVQVAGVLGNLIPWKGQEYFIRAANEVIKAVPAARFLVVGDGECRKDLESLAEKLKLRGKIIFTGRRFDIPRIIAAMDVVVHSSISPEPFARVVIESMASAKPVVAMNEGGIPEVIEDGVSGILIPPKNSSLMAQTIIDLFNDRKKARKIGLTARQNVEKNFSIEENAKKTEELYLKILNA
jgi:glycosyltransferase involved in cell wall biosynthesis